MSVYHTSETTLPDGLETSGRKVYRLYWDLGRQTKFWSFAMIFLVFNKMLVLGSLQTTLLSIVRELPRGGSAAVAVCISDR